MLTGDVYVCTQMHLKLRMNDVIYDYNLKSDIISISLKK